MGASYFLKRFLGLALRTAGRGAGAAARLAEKVNFDVTLVGAKLQNALQGCGLNIELLAELRQADNPAAGLNCIHNLTHQ